MLAQRNRQLVEHHMIAEWRQQCYPLKELCTEKGEFLTLNFDVLLCKVNPFLGKKWINMTKLSLEQN